MWFSARTRMGSIERCQNRRNPSGFSRGPTVPGARTVAVVVHVDVLPAPIDGFAKSRRAAMLLARTTCRGHSTSDHHSSRLSCRFLFAPLRGDSHLQTKHTLISGYSKVGVVRRKATSRRGKPRALLRGKGRGGYGEGTGGSARHAAVNPAFVIPACARSEHARRRQASMGLNFL